MGEHQTDIIAYCPNKKVVKKYLFLGYKEATICANIAHDV
jgi:hypothetical protein